MRPTALWHSTAPVLKASKATSASMKLANPTKPVIKKAFVTASIKSGPMEITPSSSDTFASARMVRPLVSGCCRLRGRDLMYGFGSRSPDNE